MSSNKRRVGLTFNLDDKIQAEAYTLLEDVSPRKKAEYVATALIFLNNHICDEYVNKLADALYKRITKLNLTTDTVTIPKEDFNEADSIDDDMLSEMMYLLGKEE